MSEPNSYQFWAMNRTPKKLEIGDRVYFVRDNKIESSMQVLEIKRDCNMTCDVTGREWTGKCVLILNNLRIEKLPGTIKGFRGFRYFEGS